MKNILVIGNGFDLAHDLPTSYSDFLKFLHCIKLTSSWYGNKNDFLAKYVDNENLNDFVVEFIKNAFDKRKENPNGNFSNTNSFVQEMYDILGDNIWYAYLSYVYENGKMKGVNWIDLESEISYVIEKIDKEQQNIFLPFHITVPENDAKMAIFFNLSSHLLHKYIETKDKPDKYKETYYDFIEKSYWDLRQLVRCLEIYLAECVEKIPITKISPDINGIDVQAVLNFNYTHTYANNYDPEGNDLILGECRYWNEPIGVNILRGLEAKADSVDWRRQNRHVWYVLFSAVGFTEELKDLAAARDDLLLFDE